MKKVKALIYDFDGVICDSVNVKTEAFASIYQEFGEDIVEKVVLYHLEHGGVSRFEKFKYWHKLFLDIELDESQIQELSERFSALVLEKVINAPYLPGALEFIQKNSAKYLQFICTGTPENEIIFITGEKNIQSFFNGMFGSPTKKTQIINKILLENKLFPNEVVFFGDAVTDYKAALDTAVNFVGVGTALNFLPSNHINRVEDFLQLDIENLF
jgi:phosphoglycolate phosphatase-like HAD superfamily hydrolase